MGDMHAEDIMSSYPFWFNKGDNLMLFVCGAQVTVGEVFFFIPNSGFLSLDLDYLLDITSCCLLLLSSLLVFWLQLAVLSFSCSHSHQVVTVLLVH